MASLPTDPLHDEVLADVPAFRDTLPPPFLRRYAAGEVGDEWSTVPLESAAAGPSDSPLPDLRVRADVLQGSQLHTAPAMRMLLQVYQATHTQLAEVLAKRRDDRRFVDAAVARLSTGSSEAAGCRCCIGLRDEKGEVVVGPREFDAEDLPRSAAALFEPVEIAPLPQCMRGSHVTYFCPPASAGQAEVAANVGARKEGSTAPEEPESVARYLGSPSNPAAGLDPSLRAKWGADFEDSLYPDSRVLLQASENLIQWITGDAATRDESDSRPQLSLPLKRLPNLETPDLAHLLVERNLVPQHVLDLCLHLWHCVSRPLLRGCNGGETVDGVVKKAQIPEVLAFYIPKLETEHEAAYMRLLFSTAEKILKEELAREGLWFGSSGAHGVALPELRCVVVFENARALYRAREIANALHPYMAGGSLGWHDFIASTARLMRNDPHYRIPRKTDQNLVVEVLRLSHEMLASVFGPGGGLKIGGAYGISPVFENGSACVLSVVGLIKDIFAQLRRGLDGFWIMEPSFMRPALALVAAWKDGPTAFFDVASELVESTAKEHARALMSACATGNIDAMGKVWTPVAMGAVAAGRAEIDALRHTTDSPVLPRGDARFLRQMVAAHRLSGEVNESAEDLKGFVRANTKQGLAYLFEYLCGGMTSTSTSSSGGACAAVVSCEPNANVVLAVDRPVPSQCGSAHATVPIKVTDDLATLERSRWEIWAELRHDRVPLAYFVETLSFEKQQLVRRAPESCRCYKWVDVVARLLLQLCTDFEAPVEFAPHLLLPFTIPSVRNCSDPWHRVRELCCEAASENLHEPGVKYWGPDENKQTELYSILNQKDHKKRRAPACS